MKTNESSFDGQHQSASFPWKLLFKRVWGALYIGTIWGLTSIWKHDWNGLISAVLLGFVIPPLVEVIRLRKRV